MAVRACGLLHGPNGVGKTLLVQHFLRSLPDKRYKALVLSHSSVTGTDLLRLLCTELGQTARMRRSDNVLLIRQGWQQLDRLWPVVVIDEAQNLSATALEEVRLLSCDRRDTQPPFSLLLVGDEQLLPRLQMGINAPLLARLSFCLRLEPWTLEQLSGYVQARLEQVGIHANPFEAPALALLLQAGNGLPRLFNHLAQRALEEAAAAKLPHRDRPTRAAGPGVVALGGAIGQMNGLPPSIPANWNNSTKPIAVSPVKTSRCVLTGSGFGSSSSAPALL